MKRLNIRRISNSGRFRRNGRMNPDEFIPNFVLGAIFDETAEFLPNFAVRDVSNETAESVPPNFALGTFLTKRPNFRRISHSGTFPTKQPNQSRRISPEFHTRGRFRQNG
ncbi:MAG: hypothetical protein Q8881_03135 [Sweet potato little leaf phytoplasma]|nr:hypothetical protein [Sweet potato little leaf phytoplasma]